MAVRVTKRKRIVVLRNTGPRRIETLKTFCWPAGIDVTIVDFDHTSGRADMARLEQSGGGDVAGIYVENPNYFGVIEEDVEGLAELAHRWGALFIVGVDPTSLGVLRPPGEYGADIVVGEGQPLGLHMNYGGPLLGVFATREDQALIRQMPGRIMGLTKTKRGDRRAYAMVLQTREQHIRREQATSNICTNEALCALAAAVYLALLGPEGMRKLGETILANSHYASQLLSEVEGVRSPMFTGSFFKDFTVLFDKADPSKVFKELLKHGIAACLPLAPQYLELKSAALLSVTEVHSPGDIHRLATAVGEVVRG